MRESVMSLRCLAAWACLAVAATSLRARDCNGNGKDDAAEIAADPAVDCNGNDTPDDCELTPFTYAPKGEPISAGSQPFALSTGDINGDGIRDLAVVGYASDDVTVLLGAEAGGFEPKRPLPAGDGPVAILLADLDGDGHLDVAAPNSSSDDMLVARGAGDGTFLDSQFLPVATIPRSIAAADLDSDGDLDLLTASATRDSVSLLRNAGGGHFAPFESLTVGDSPRSLVAVDLEGDGDVDIAAANFAAGTVSILLNGGGDFASAGDVKVGKAPSALASGDWNGDGHVDLVTADSGARGVTVLLGDGHGALSPSLTLRPPASPRNVLAADLDGNGTQDILATYPAVELGTMSIFRGNGDGTFHEAEPQLGIATATQTIAADFDGDGILELAVASQSEGTVGLLGRADARGISLSQATVSARLPPHCMTLGDFDGDQDLDIATGNGGTGQIAVFVNAGDGTFPTSLVSMSGNYLLRIAAGDLDGDADLDLVAGYSDANVLLNKGNGSFGQPRLGNNIQLSAGLAFTDLDADGDLDLIHADVDVRKIGIARNNGKGMFTAGEGLVIDRAPLSLTIADLDADGQVDIAAAHGAGAISVLLGKPGGELSKPRAFSGPLASFWIAAGDVDGDGDPDLITTGNMFLNDGSASFRPGKTFTGEERPIFLTTGDLNEDEQLDVVTAQESPGSISIVLNAGGGEFAEPIERRVDSGLRSVQADDFDGDGDLDLATANRGASTVSIFTNGFTRGPAYLERICTEAELSQVSIHVDDSGEARRAAKFLAPSRDDPALLPTLYQNVSRYPLHQEFLAQAFPERFPALGPEEYLDLTGRRSTRQYYTGGITLLSTSTGPLHGFSVYTDNSQKSELLTVAETKALHDALLGSFHLRPFAYYPDTRSASEEAKKWASPGFPIYFGSAPKLSYEAYTRGTNYGRVRVLDARAFAEANEDGRLGWQDVLILEQAPRDIEGVVAGVITGEPQGALSHLAVRTARRGTPNAYLENATEALRSFDGKLVRIEVRESGHVLRETDLAEADDWWAANRPRLTEEPALDADYAELDSLTEIDLSREAKPESRFGGKATNLARLQRILGGPFERYRELGFAIPVRFYVEFLRSNKFESALEPGREVTYEEYLLELLESPRFQGDSGFRFESLARFREEAQANGIVDDALVRRIALRIAEVFGSTTGMVRFRSSSNVEDALEFNGAGLYESVSGCAADDLDQDESGPSRCDRTKNKERPIAAALRQVWSSLWTFRGNEERAYYQVPQDRIAMAVLVTRAHLTERANGVAFTGNPSNAADRRYIVTAQLGEESVVSPEPGVTPEVDALEIQAGAVSKIARVKRSTLVPDGQVLTDAQLQELGAALAHADALFPIELGQHPRSDVLLDVEFKIEEDGLLSIKQVRPFLTSPPEPPGPTFELVIPGSRVVCGTFVVGRDLPQEHELKSQLRWKAGTLSLPTNGKDIEADLFEELFIGPEEVRATPAGSGTFRFEKLSADPSKVTYSFELEQPWNIAGGEGFQLRLTGLAFQVIDGVPVALSKTVDEAIWTGDFAVEVGPIGDSGRFINYGPCSFGALPLWNIDAELEDGVRLHIEERMRPSILETSPVSLEAARVILPGSTIDVSDYFRLIYSALRHNQAPRYRIVLPSPITLPLVSRPVHAIELYAAEPALRIVAKARYVDEDLKIISQRSLTSFRRELAGESPVPGFRRGDFDASGVLDLTDAVGILSYLFRAGAAPGCRSSADANDDGKINVTDAITVLLHLFAGRGPLPSPFDACGADPTEDALGCDRFAPCG